MKHRQGSCKVLRTGPQEVRIDTDAQTEPRQLTRVRKQRRPPQSTQLHKRHTVTSSRNELTTPAVTITNVNVVDSDHNHLPASFETPSEGPKSTLTSRPTRSTLADSPGPALFSHPLPRCATATSLQTTTANPATTTPKTTTWDTASTQTATKRQPGCKQYTRRSTAQQTQLRGDAQTCSLERVAYSMEQRGLPQHPQRRSGKPSITPSSPQVNPRPLLITSSCPARPPPHR